MWHGDGGGGGGVGDGMSGSDDGGGGGGGGGSRVGGVMAVNVCASDEREGKGKGEKTLIQDEYNEGKELCKEIKKKSRERKKF